jgi:hypothetical protein
MRINEKMGSRHGARYYVTGLNIFMGWGDLIPPVSINAFDDDGNAFFFSFTPEEARTVANLLRQAADQAEEMDHAYAEDNAVL